MKKILLLLFVFLFCLKGYASDTKVLPYKNIKQKAGIYYTEASGWTMKHQKNADIAFKRVDNSFFSADTGVEFDTGCDYIFINKASLIGYSSSDLKFYKFIFNESNEYVLSEELTYSEAAQMFNDFRIILISDFSETTNSFIFNKKRRKENIMLLNDTPLSFDNYDFSTNNSKFKKYNINNALEITRKGLIQFSTKGDDTKASLWFILLVR